MPISFDNTENAFAYKSDEALRKARLLFGSMGKPLLVRLGTRLTPWAMRSGIPIKGLIRRTIFAQFVGGETLAETGLVAENLGRFGVSVILDYGVEGKDGEENFDQATAEFVRVIDYAASRPNIPFMSIKVTGLARFGLLEKMHALAHRGDAVIGHINLEGLSADEKAEWERVRGRMERICSAAAKSRVGVLVDAEETWIQDPVDALTFQMMARFNRNRPVIYNTIQLYRHDRLAFLRGTFGAARDSGFLLAVKLVRGAYMEKERVRAQGLGYASPIQPDKASTDRDYDRSLEFCAAHIEELPFIVASHNEQSNLLAAQLVKADHPHVHFSQLYGMSDHITFNLAKAGYSVSKYLPFGPIQDVIPYLMRRAEENSSVSGQTGRELSLIKKELRRRQKV